MKKVATIILNRNLPDVTNRLYERFQDYDAKETDVFIVESGSSKKNLSKHYTWWANWEDSLEHGLRYPRGFNYALSQLWDGKKFKKYDYFFLICNDAEFEERPIIKTLTSEMIKHPRVGILSPCSPLWGEQILLNQDDTKYFWYTQFVSWFVRREYIEDIMAPEKRTYMNFLFDGGNFRGYEADIELIIKGYANDWATAITTKVLMNENETYLKTRADLMKTDPYDENLKKVLNEGKKWLRRKYGFNSRWTINLYSKFFYDQFFVYYPEFSKYKI